jgi:hypothetical protein
VISGRKQIVVTQSLLLSDFDVAAPKLSLKAARRHETTTKHIQARDAAEADELELASGARTGAARVTSPRGNGVITPKPSPTKENSTHARLPVSSPSHSSSVAVC